MSKNSFSQFYDDQVYAGWEDLPAFQRVERLLKAHGRRMDGGRFSDALYHPTPTSQPVRLINVSHPTPSISKVTFSFTVPTFYCNGYNNLHGAAQALLYDNLTTLSLAAISRPGFWMLGGVSRVLDVKYLRPIPLGTEIRIEVEVLAAGRNSSALRGVMRDERGRVLSSCEHDKANIDPVPAKDVVKAKL